MKKETIIIMLLCFTLQGNAQETAMCTYDASGNRLSRFIYVDRSRNLQRMTDRDGCVEMANERLGGHTIHVNFNTDKKTITIEVLGLDDSDRCSVNIYNLTGQLVQNQDITNSPTEIELYDISNGVYLVRLTLNGESKCWKIIKR